MVRLLAGAIRSSLDSSDDMSRQHRTSTNGSGHNHSHYQKPTHADSVQQQPPPSPQQQQQHTLVLIQSTPQPSSRTYSDHPSLDSALDGIVAAFEQQLPAHPSSGQQHLQYDITQLFGFVDRLPDLALLVYSPALKAYEPHDKHFIKSAVYEHLKRQAAGQ